MESPTHLARFGLVPVAGLPHGVHVLVVGLVSGDSLRVPEYARGLMRCVRLVLLANLKPEVVSLINLIVEALEIEPRFVTARVGSAGRRDEGAERHGKDNHSDED